MKASVLYISTPKFIDLIIEHIHLCSKINFTLILCLEKNEELEYELLKHLQQSNIRLILLKNTSNKLWISIKITLLSFIHNPRAIHLDGLSGVTSLILILRFKKTIVSLHDVKPHTGEDVWFNLIRDKLLFLPRQIVLFSKYSFNQYNKLYYRKNNSSLINLPVYSKIFEIVNEENSKISFENYYLIFGRISPYKGIEKFIQEFISTNSKNEKLIIAGLPNYDFKPIPDKNIQYILEYISYGRLKYLLNYCNGVIVPYLDATQSGVVSTAKAFNKKIYMRKIDAFLEFKNDTSIKLYNDKFNCEILEFPIEPKNLNFNKNYYSQFMKIYNDL